MTKLTVRNVDASGNAGATKSQDVKRGEVGSQKGVLLVLTGPRQVSQQVLRSINQRLELGTHGFVHHGNEACKTEKWTE